MYRFAFATLLCAFALAMLLGRSGADQKFPFTKKELEKLEKGEVVIKHSETKISDKEQKSLLVSSVLIRHPEEVLWEVLDHPEREKEWIPHVKVSKVVKDVRPTPTTRVNVTDYRISGFGGVVYYSLVREYDYKAKTIRGHLDKTRPRKFFIDVQNGWNFIPHKGAIIFQYWSDSKLTLKIPKIISKQLGELQLVAGAKAMVKRCDFIAREMKSRKKK